MATVTALTGKVNFVDIETKYNVEICSGGERFFCRPYPFDTYEMAVKYIEEERRKDGDNPYKKYLLSEVTTKTMGVF